VVLVATLEGGSDAWWFSLPGAFQYLSIKLDRSIVHAALREFMINIWIMVVMVTFKHHSFKSSNPGTK
jgi:hypothetical protein